MVENSNLNKNCFVIFFSVHDQLSKIDKETADSFRKSGSLLDKLTYLINANGSGQTMLFSITLPGKSPSKSAVAHVKSVTMPLIYLLQNYRS